jgi:hypothetical protein
MMKKLGLLFVGAFILASCDATPGGNQSIYPVVHDEPVEKVDHHGDHGDHAHHEDHATETAEGKDSTHAVEAVVETPKDSAK